MSREISRVYPYTDENSTERFQKVRYALDPPGPDGRSKDFRYRFRADPSHVWTPGLPFHWNHLVYELPRLIRYTQTGNVGVHWTEGEKDADALTKAGVLSSSHHGGAGKCYIDQAEYFLNAAHVYLWMDRDEAGGLDAYRRVWLLRMLGYPLCRISVVCALTGNDAHDHLTAGHNVQDARPVDLGWLAAKVKASPKSTFRAHGYRQLDDDSETVYETEKPAPSTRARLLQKAQVS